MRSWVAQLRKGLVELCVLGVLRDGETYGYEILQRLKAAEGLAITESTVYPILARLSDEGLLKVRVTPSPAGPPRRYYRLTPLGLTRMRDMADYWNQIVQAVGDLLKGERI